MIRPALPLPPTSGYGHTKYQGSWAAHEDAMRVYLVDMLDYLAARLDALHEHRPSREEPRVRFYREDSER